MISPDSATLFSEVVSGAADYERCLEMRDFAPRPPAFCRRAIDDWMARNSAATLLLDAMLPGHGPYRFLLDPPGGFTLLSVTAKCRFAPIVPDVDEAQAAWLALCGVPAASCQHLRVDLATGSVTMMFALGELGEAFARPAPSPPSPPSPPSDPQELGISAAELPGTGESAP